MLKRNFERVEKHLIGLWRFRERGRRRLWCATYEVDGYYYDISGKPNVDEALEAVHRELVKHRGERNA